MFFITINTPHTKPTGKINYDPGPVRWAGNGLE